MKWWSITRKKADLERELQSDLDLEEEEQRERGLPPEEARYAARRAFGNNTLIREQTHEAWGWVPFERLWQDIRYALRQSRKSPGFTMVVVLMLALGIGANTAVFSVMNAILMQLLPVQRPHGLYYVRMANGEGQPPSADGSGDSQTSFSEAAFEALRQRRDILEDLIGYVPLSFVGSVAVRHGELPESAEGEEASGNFFSGLSVRMERGRGFTLEDEKQHSPIVVLSYDYWTRSFARDPDILGQTIYIKGVPFTVVGITAHGFKGIEPATATDFWIPLQNRPELNAWGVPAGSETLYGSPKWWCLRMMARLRPGLSPAQAQQALSGTLGAAVQQTIGNVDPKAWKPLLDFVEARGVGGYSETYRTPVAILMGLVALVLLIACTNVAMMVQARNTVREHEFSLRLAIGARQGSIFRQLLCESLLLVGAGAALAWLFAVSATTLLASWSGIETGLHPDTTVLLFTLTISIVAALTFSLVPLWSAMRAPVAGVLRSTSTTTTASRHRVSTSRVVLSTQIAICLVLLMAGGLLLRTLRNYATQDLGIQANNLLVFGLTPMGNVDGHVFYRRIIDRLRQVPGVESVSMASNRPGTGWSDNNDLDLDGVPQRGVVLRTDDVGPDFFHTMGIPLIAGRDVNNADQLGAQSVAIVNETFVKRLLANTHPLRHVITSSGEKWTIVGVARDSKYTAVNETPMPMAYYPAMQKSSLATMHLEVRARGEAMALLPAMRQALAEMYPAVPLQQPMTQHAQFDKSYERQRMFASLGGFFGILAALLVATGLYGTHSFRVNRRTTEIGIRMALGASRGQVLRIVMVENLWILAFGLAAGVPLTLLAVLQLKTMLYEISPFDPTAFALAIAILLLVSTGAALVAARRAASVDPIRALRTD
jgi:predicted permease